MIDIILLDQFKDIYLEVLKQNIGKEFDKDSLYLSENDSIVKSIEDDVAKLNLTIKLFFKAKENNDELAMQAALLRISTFLSGIYGVLYQTREDIDLFSRIPNIENFPEDYKIPDHYNYPIK
ncbi:MULTISPECIES: hypothetical protein [unclassified Symbiopectobacterium]|uniref:hypothetical protein n=1 Tax=unclassified Symbiopectobacterium TaxID=2794573 RepID=UPI0022269633|nr:MULTISPECIES: hypothetical protein [unclassified Symbiopectobacterium]MCW2476134.1 hypothetical protein [Candidatus Symbiopectobacterium sp. NZEC151]MCW2482541.1 hypothetical protein [Candidatus Symbiopectobacterium sp. NZEC135]